jgi:hypothetical protein
MKRFTTSLVLVCLLMGLTSISHAAFTAGMTQQCKNDMMTAAYVTGSPTIKLALGLQSANTAFGPASTTYAGFTDLGTAHGYTTGGNTLSSCTVASTAGSSPLAADFNCTGGLVWTATDATGITADCAVLYNSTSGKIIALYTFTSAAATGNGATFTITPPTVSTSVRGMAYIQ